MSEEQKEKLDKTDDVSSLNSCSGGWKDGMNLSARMLEREKRWERECLDC